MLDVAFVAKAEVVEEKAVVAAEGEGNSSGLSLGGTGCERKAIHGLFQSAFWASVSAEPMIR